ncbi:angiogenin-2 [Chelonia mydas]|uniref:angiogenin-2 n=1 Tax=Chelonia mydas TaxID=8469 RepID=UPI0018A20AC2|nr:angiogenin-2 [Chelonia mydas]
MALKGMPVLLLLAAALVLLGAPATADQYEKFLLQHVDANPTGRDDKYCTKQMRHILKELWKLHPNPERKVCKDPNTFIHANSNAIRAICTDEGGTDYRTKSGQIMRQSRDGFQVTTCNRPRGKPINNCRYRAAADFRTIVIACNAQGFPVHFEESQI